MNKDKETLQLVVKDPAFIKLLKESVEEIKNDDVIPVDKNYFREE